MRPLFACMLCFTFAAQAAPAPDAPPPMQAADPPGSAGSAVSADGQAGSPLPLRARLDREAIRAAIAGLAEEKETVARGQDTEVLSAAPYGRFSRDFSKARLPVCLHAEGLRNQPTFFLSGVLALPFVAVAKIRGVCR